MISQTSPAGGRIHHFQIGFTTYRGGASGLVTGSALRAYDFKPLDRKHLALSGKLSAIADNLRTTGLDYQLHLSLV